MPVNSQPLKPYIGLVFTTVKNRPIMSSFGSSARNLVEISENNQTSKIFSRNFENAANKPEFIRVAPVQQVKFFFLPQTFLLPLIFPSLPFPYPPFHPLSTLSSPYHPSQNPRAELLMMNFAQFCCPIGRLFAPKNGRWAAPRGR